MGDNPTQTSPTVVKDEKDPNVLLVDGVRMVKESDLISVKKGAEGKETEYLSNLAEANRLKDEAHQNFLQEQTVRGQFEEKANESDTLKTRVSGLETENATLTEGRKQLEEQLLGMKRTHLTTLYGASEESLKDKDMSQLNNLEEALKVVGSGKTKPAKYDLGVGAGTGVAPATVLEGAKQELVVARELQRKKAQGDTDYLP